jgi:hypothetical protein
MNLILIFLLLSMAGLFSSFFYFKKKRYKEKQLERSLKMVYFLVLIPQNSGIEKKQSSRDEREISREIISLAENFYYTLSSTFKKGFESLVVGQKHISLEIVSVEGKISFYLGVPAVLTGLVEKTISAQYPDAHMEKTNAPNIFNDSISQNDIDGGELLLKKNDVYPIKTFNQIDFDPLDPITNSLSKLDPGEGAGIQILIRPAGSIGHKAKKIVSQIQKGESTDSNNFTKDIGKDLINAALGKNNKEDKPHEHKITPAQEEAIRAIEKKAAKPIFETAIKFVVASKNTARRESIKNEITSSFYQFNDHHLNQFSTKGIKNKKQFIDEYILNFYPKKSFLLSTEELSSVFHLPNYLITTPGINWLSSKKTAAPTNLPQEGTILGETVFRGETKEVRVTKDDQRRHIYILGQTGTGKTNTLKNMIIDGINKGEGICYIDPHGQDLEDILNKIPKERAEDVIVFDAGDIDRPIGLNLFDAKTIEEQDFVIQEAITMLYKLYDPGHTGIVGPRFEHWFRNAALTVMADPEGGTFLEIPKLFTDQEFLNKKLSYLKDPIVRNFWLNEMAQTSDFHKSEVLGWFIGKFGAFMTNTTMRNILGQVESTFRIREAMDSGKIVLVNLAKGKIGELNMSLLGMIIVSKFQMAAMSRIDTPEDQRRDFYLYVDEFQNFATDSFASILSEARKFKLNLTVANQFIGQLKEEIKNAVFGNVGTILCFRVGPEDADFMVKQFEPVFSSNDLTNIENFHAIIKLMIKGLPTRPFSIKGLAPMGHSDTERGNAIKQLSRLKYGKEKSLVDKEVMSKMAIVQ